MKSSEELYKFYKSWLHNVEMGAPDHFWFNRRAGLCFGLWELFCDDSLAQELRQQFYDAGLSENYPFNDGCEDYAEDVAQGSHKNPKRIQWVKDRIAEYENS